ncbi:Cu(I)-responsive transcriptional regulator [Lichenifustis flavocetrariae]|uniref:Cu(I)-responsive transcriptional regulator n=1 Tax=Lichenifustis flavocetrariae TaxID=2949735 RepID=A0AA41Z7F1_9HYPH|nr:Cu(I)-responsive transcriptional regulator [Lichenifustis flavocetrariae]MCW6511873.1 Cu(I)-responsive transcriptional regulator [Lichenifustis flavocetrariae]
MQIGQAAKASGVTAKMIRHYEAIGLVPSAGRQPSNYRDYDDADVHRLRFIRRSRDLGFPMDRIRDLLKLWSDRHRSSSEVKAIALAHVAEMETRIAHMREMADVLHALADACEGNGRPECPIIRGLEGSDAGGPRMPAYLPPGSVNH